MADIITTLHRKDSPSDNVYPNVKDENIPDTIQRKLTAGENVTITSDNVISATQAQGSKANFFNYNNVNQGYITGIEGNVVSPFYQWYYMVDPVPYDASVLGNTFYVYKIVNGVVTNCQSRMITYDNDGNALEYLNSLQDNGNPVAITLSSSTKQIRISANIGGTNTDNLYNIVASNILGTTYYSYDSIISYQAQINDLRNQVSNKVSNYSRLTGMKYLAVGDSITAGTNVTLEDGVRKTYDWWVAEWNSMELTKNAVGGGTIAESTGTRDKFVTRYETLFNQFSGEEIFLSIFYGINDSQMISQGNESLGTIVADNLGSASTFDQTTFIGAYQTILNSLCFNDNYKLFHPLVIIPSYAKPSGAEDIWVQLISLCNMYGVKYLSLGSANMPQLWGVQDSYQFSGAYDNLGQFYGGHPNTSAIMNHIRSNHTPDSVHIDNWCHKVLGGLVAHYLQEA